MSFFIPDARISKEFLKSRGKNVLHAVSAAIFIAAAFDLVAIRYLSISVLYSIMSIIDIFYHMSFFFASQSAYSFRKIRSAGANAPADLLYAVYLL